MVGIYLDPNNVSRDDDNDAHLNRITTYESQETILLTKNVEQPKRHK
jgi:hypothetical protein